MLAATPQKLPLPIHLTLFNGSSTSAGNITHCIQTTLTFANSQWQDLWLLVTCLHASAPLFWASPGSTPPTFTLIGRTSHSTLTAKLQSAWSPSPLMSPPQSAPPTTSTLPCNSVQSPPGRSSSMPDSANPPKSSPPSSTAVMTPKIVPSGVRVGSHK
ncbi:hypothetical protein C0993_004604, partial [Termitomyces sp. T159_Od127]